LEREILPDNWNCGLKLSPKHKAYSEEPLYWIELHPSHPVVHDLRDYIHHRMVYIIKSMESDFEAFNEYKLKGHIFRPDWGGGYDSRDDVFYCPISRGYVPILIDPGGLTKHNLTAVLEEIKQILITTLKMQRYQVSEEWGRKAYRIPRERQLISRIGDPPEIAFIYHVSDVTFDTHLKWYELHMGKNPLVPEGFTFRTIASLEIIEEKNPAALEKAKIRLKEMRPKGKQNLKGVIGEPRPGEDNIEKAVKLIYQAIHRKSYPARKSRKLFSCPIHGNECPKTCPNLKESMKRFNERYRLDRQMTYHGDLDYVPDPSGESLPAKSKGEKIKGKMED
jgi:hypothetical protein